MKVSEKKPYHHGDLRQSLIEGAIALITEAGVSQVSLREVARRVGVSHNAPYRHFSDKEALLAAVAEQGFQSLKQAMVAAQDSLADPAARLTAIGVAYVQFACQQPAYYRVMFGAYSNQVSQDKAVEISAGKAFEVLVEVIRTGQAQQVFRAGDPLQLAQVAWSLVHGQAMLAIDGKLPISEGFAEFLTFSAQILIDGLAV